METIYKTEVLRFFGIGAAKITYSYTTTKEGCFFKIVLQSLVTGQEMNLAVGFQGHPVDKVTEMLEKFSQNLSITREK